MTFAGGPRNDDRTNEDDDLEPEPPMPWRAAAPHGDPATGTPVLIEKWDDELPIPTRADAVASAFGRTKLAIGPAAWHALGLVAFAAAVIGALLGFAIAWIHLTQDPLADAHAYYDAASRLNAGHALYPAGIDPSTNRIYLYPPLFAVLLRPLALLPYEAFALVWELIVVASFVLLLRYLGLRRRSTWIAIGILGIPIGWALTVAQAHVPMTLFLAIGQPWSIALAANMKLFPAAIAIWWLGRRDFQAFGAFLVWTALLVGAQLLLAWDATLAFFGSVGFAQIGEVRNFSPYVQSPWLWFGLVLLGALVTLGLARTRWGWAAAVTFATLSPPRLLTYMFMGLLAAIRQPLEAGKPNPHTPIDAASAYNRSVR